MENLKQTILYASGTLLLYGAYQTLAFIYRRSRSPLLNIPGPKSDSLIFGNIKQIIDSPNHDVLHETWFDKYGTTYKYNSIFNRANLCTKDNRALSHILSHTDIYQKPDDLRNVLTQIFGDGLLVVEGVRHKHQRKIMNPAFGPAQIRALATVFTEKALTLRDRWAAEISSDSSSGTRIDVLRWLNNATLDVIGEAGFNYRFDALNPSLPTNELNEAFRKLFNATQELSLILLLQEYLPIFRVIPTERETQIKLSRKTMDRIGERLLEDSKANVAADKENTLAGKDLLTLLVKANSAVEASGEQKLNDADVLAQVPTFLVAGHETTSSAVTWALFALSEHPSTQARLRAECLSLVTESPSMEELNSLSYLDCVVKETMRIHAPVPSTTRAAVKDDVIPLDEPYVDTKGVKHFNIKISKGDMISINIRRINRDEALWGRDGASFRPERWESAETLKMASANGIPGIWGNQLTFLGGARSCIGYRFALLEMKALLYTLIRAFEFDLAVPASHIISKQSVVARPIVTSERDAGNQMPLLVKAYRG